MLNIYHSKNIDDFKWSHRMLIVIKNSNKPLDFLENYKKDFDKRDLILLEIFKRDTFINDKLMSSEFSNSILKKISNIKNNSSIILIGKDGEIKNSYQLNINIKEVFNEIDSMPMRKFEIRNKL